METPNPTMEEYQAVVQSQKEQLRQLTPDKCPYFHAIISGTNSQSGVRIAWVTHLQLITGHITIGAEPIALPLERPDQVAILPDHSKELYRFTIAATHFFVTDDGLLCCLVPQDGTEKGEKQAAKREPLILLEGDAVISPPTGLMGDVSFPYAKIRDAVKARNELWKVSPPEELQKVIQDEWLNKPEAKHLAPRSDVLANILRFTGDNIHRAAITAWARAAQWQDGEEYFKGLQQEYSNLKITVSLPNGEKAASLWEFLQRGGAAMVKAHYALWARYYEQVPDGFEMQDVVVNVSDFCRDLGYSKAKSGGYKPEAKRRAMQLLEALTTTEMAATYQVPDTKKGHTKTRRMKGTIWRRGLEAEERDTYEDLFGNARAGDPGQWIPCSFSFSPGAWHADKEWRRHNKFVGKIGAGLMQLDVRYDEWAILIAGYLGTLARTGRYRNRRLKISTILENTGLNEAIGHRKAQFREKFYRALDRLVEEKIIAEYKTEGFDDSDVDPDDLEALASYGQNDPFPKGDWRAAIVEFEFDFAADMHRLETRKTKAIVSKKKRAKKKVQPKAPTPAV